MDQQQSVVGSLDTIMLGATSDQTLADQPLGTHKIATVYANKPRAMEALIYKQTKSFVLNLQTWLIDC